VAIRLAVNGHRSDAQFLARANDAQGNFSAIRDEDFLKHFSSNVGTEGGLCNLVIE
jgi:hypothetical protein